MFRNFDGLEYQFPILSCLKKTWFNRTSPNTKTGFFWHLRDLFKDKNSSLTLQTTWFFSPGYLLELIVYFKSRRLHSYKKKSNWKFQCSLYLYFNTVFIFYRLSGQLFSAKLPSYGVQNKN